MRASCRNHRPGCGKVRVSARLRQNISCSGYVLPRPSPKPLTLLYILLYRPPFTRSLPPSTPASLPPFLPLCLPLSHSPPPKKKAPDIPSLALFRIYLTLWCAVGPRLRSSIYDVLYEWMHNSPGGLAV